MPRAALICFVILVGCGDAPPPDAPSAALDVPARELRPGIRIDRILAASDDATLFLPSLRPSRGQRAEPIASRHVPGQVDTVRTWTYDGLTLEVYDVTGGPSIVRQLAVTSDAYGTADGLAVGEARPDLEATLGRPMSERGRVATYRSAEVPATTIRVTYEPDAEDVPRAVAIEWRHAVD